VDERIKPAMTGLSFGKKNNLRNNIFYGIWLGCNKSLGSCASELLQPSECQVDVTDCKKL
jgi:hypothetical protein